MIDLIYNFSNKYLPAIEPPKFVPTLKEKAMWTMIALIIFFIMYNTTVIGTTLTSTSMDFLQTITASRIGTLLTTGIGPLILASIFLQLFQFSGLLDLDIHTKEGQEKFHEVQKILGIVLAFAEGWIFVSSGRIPLVEPGSLMWTLIVVLQITLGSVILLYLDELLAKYGLMSGISLFIAAGVSYIVLSGSISLIFGQGGVVSVMAEGGADSLANALLVILPIVFTIIVFIVTSYGESVRVEIPITYGTARGFIRSIPFKYFYLSNIPVIFASALLLNVQLFASGLVGLQDYSVAGIKIFQIIGAVDGNGRLYDGLLYLISPIYAAGRGTIEHMNFIFYQETPLFHIPEWVHAILYVLFLSILSVLFGIFWAETAGQDPKSLAEQFKQANLSTPGYRNDPRTIERKLNEYIPYLIFVGSFSVGLLAGLADLLGTLGTGTGILLTVGILYRGYEELVRMGAFQVYPSIAKWFE